MFGRGCNSFGTNGLDTFASTWLLCTLMKACDIVNMLSMLKMAITCWGRSSNVFSWWQSFATYFTFCLVASYLCEIWKAPRSHRTDRTACFTRVPGRWSADTSFVLQNKSDMEIESNMNFISHTCMWRLLEFRDARDQWRIRSSVSLLDEWVWSCASRSWIYLGGLSGAFSVCLE